MKPKTGAYIDCKNCKKEYWVFRSLTDRGQGKFCSMDCYTKYNRKIDSKKFTSALIKIASIVNRRKEIKDSVALCKLEELLYDN